MSFVYRSTHAFHIISNRRRFYLLVVLVTAVDQKLDYIGQSAKIIKG